MNSSHAECRGFSFPYEARTLDEIVKMLQAEQMTFRTFECISEGEYAMQDAAWNYMDIPHLKYVHKQVDGVLTLASDAVTASVFFQRIPLMRLPLTVLTYQTATNQVTYYTSFGFYILIIETLWNALDATHTRVTTRYAVGWASWIAAFFYPAIRWLLMRNYRILMSEDTPMRKQRGALRRQGYDFKMSGEIPSFIDSRKILQTNVLIPDRNVIAPAECTTWGPKEIAYDPLSADGPCFVGAADHLGLTVVRSGEVISVYPRLCPHEGASLDEAARTCAGADRNACVLQCPWHGRKFKPVVSLPRPTQLVVYESPWHRYEFMPEGLVISCKDVDHRGLVNSDWSQPAALVARS